MQALIALGGNLNFGMESPDKILVSAIHAIASAGLPITRQSRLYQTPAFPAGSGPSYVNGAVAVDLPTHYTPDSLYHVLSGIEQAHGRQRSQRWGGRTLDLDILAIDGQIHPDMGQFMAWANMDPSQQAQIAPSTVILPHPRLHERGFVLVPLMDIAPDWLHPVFQKSVRHLHDALAQADIDSVTPLYA